MFTAFTVMMSVVVLVWGWFVGGFFGKSSIAKKKKKSIAMSE